MKAETYFNTLNYTLSNEDTSLELALSPDECDHLLAITGSGARVLPLFAKLPKRVTCVDHSPAQLALTQLRIETLRTLSHPDFLAFWGYPGKEILPTERREIFHQCALDDRFRALLVPAFEEAAWHSILHAGGWERTIRGFSKIIQTVMGRSLERFFACQTPEEASHFLQTSFPHWRWKGIVAVLANANTFNALLYKGRFPRRNIPDSYYRHYLRGFDRLFRMGIVRENYLLQLVLLGAIRFPEGVPLEADPALFERMKAGIEQAEIHYLEGNLLERVDDFAAPVDFLSFSDVPSYFEGEAERRFLQILKPGLSEGAKLAIRYFFHLPEGLDDAGFVQATERYRELIAEERTPFYQIEVLEKA